MNGSSGAIWLDQPLAQLAVLSCWMVAGVALVFASAALATAGMPTAILRTIKAARIRIFIVSLHLPSGEVSGLKDK